MTVRRVSLARARKTAGYTQESLAEALHVERTTVVRWEAGTSEPMPHIRPKLAHLLRVSCNNLEVLLSPLNATPVPKEVIASLLTRLMETDADGSTANRGDGIYDSFTALREWVNMNRRELIRLLGLTAASTAVSPVLAGVGGLNPDEQERVVGAIARPERVDGQVIGHIENVLSVALGNDMQLGPQAALHTVLAQQNLLRSMAADCPDTMRPRLLSVLANALRVAGYLTFNDEDFGGARRYYGHARTVAHEAGDIQLAAFILTNMGHVSLWTGTPCLAVDHTVAAQQWVKQVDSPTVQAFASDMAACAYAAIGDHDAAMRQLEITERCLPACAGQASSPFYSYSRTLHTSRRGKSLLRLGRAGDAIGAISESLASSSPSKVRDIALTKLDLSKAYIQTKEIDEAAKIVGEAANLATQNRSARLLKELHTTRTALQPWQATSAVKALDEQLHSFGVTGQLSMREVRAARDDAGPAWSARQ